MSENDAGRKIRDAAEHGRLMKVKAIIKSFPGNMAVMNSKNSSVSDMQQVFKNFSGKFR